MISIEDDTLVAEYLNTVKNNRKIENVEKLHNAKSQEKNNNA